MNRHLSLFLAALTVGVLSGCASAPFMPLADDNPKADASKPLYLMSVVVKNEYKQRWQPRVLNVFLKSGGSAGKPKSIVFRMDQKGVVEPVEDDKPQTFLVRFTTDGSPTTVVGMNAMASAFPIHGFYFVPLHSRIAENNGDGVYYLGAVKAIIRERKDNEFRAGPLIPLIDQAFAGASGGTFDVEFSDFFDADVETFKKAFPSLKDTVITKAIMAPWDRVKAQSAWEKD